jgi:4-diphosphocytidyl-2-C-methyl-D-erythritol kinase
MPRSGGLSHGECISAEAPAKINLVLEVLGRRPDGYHALRSVLAPLALADIISVVRLPPGEADRLSIEGSVPDLGPPERNLVLQAVDALRSSARRKTGRGRLDPLAFTLVKRIPVAAGLGGGSSDGALALDLAARAWGLRIGVRRRRHVAASLGSDVPFFTLGSWALIGGRGDRLSPLPAVPGMGVLLVIPPARLATRDVFAAWDAANPGGTGAHRRRRSRGPSPATALATSIRSGITARELTELAAANDLWAAAAALEAGLEPFRLALAEHVGRCVHLSGSGTCLFALYEGSGEAAAAAVDVRAALLAGSLPSPWIALPSVVGTCAWRPGQAGAGTE